MERVIRWMVPIRFFIIICLLSVILWKLGDQKKLLLKESVLTDNNGRVIYPYLQREVKNTITANARDIQICFNGLIEKNPEISKTGNVHLDWRISESGKPHALRVVFSSYQNEPFESCLLNAVKAWTFPPPGKAIYAEHRFQFSRKE